MTTMQRFDPFREMRHFNRLFNSPLWAAHRWGDPMEDGVETAGEAWSIPMDVARNDRQLTATASLPGFAADDVDVSISPDRILSVKATRQSEVSHEGEEYLMRERRSGSFSRAIRLPSDLNLDDASVALEHGVLTVTVPVAEAAQTRRLQISNPAGASNADAC
ncbi:MAG: Hsp20/alpha crystallin family protein [Chloroflexi bacterium]|nr:Hsp20/alpha crystallin family protein [Chloroflexota bacterium]